MSAKEKNKTGAGAWWGWVVERCRLIFHCPVREGVNRNMLLNTDLKEGSE